MKKIITTVLFAVTLVSCTKEFKEINTSKNGVKNTTPETLLTSALHDVITRNLNRAMRLTNELMQVHVTTSDADEIHRYVIRPLESDYMWNNWYLQLTNFKDMYKGASVIKSNNYMGIALIMDVWVSSLITDTYGDVPYSQANQGKEQGILQPKFDSQQSIYASLFSKLEEANTRLKAATEIPDAEKGLEPLYNGDMVKWRKFGNSLYLRLLMRVSGRTELNAAAKITEIVDTRKADYPIFTSNDDSAILRFQSTPPLVSEFYNYRDLDFNSGSGLGEFFINNLNNWEDPRLEKWATKFENSYQGIKSGYPVGQVPAVKSRYSISLKNEPLLGNIMNYAELQFILAEASVRGLVSGTAQTYYENGVKAAITMWGYTVPSDYLTATTAKWDPTNNAYQMTEKIMLQKYYALFFTDFQQWFEYRRTGFPILPKGEGLQNGGQMPSRLKYPVNVQSLNSANYKEAVANMGGDDLNVKVWWNK
ncbi:SusD/RagB family nutrient-binding outer membrane lipoprotein [Pedobacter africanus]|uniref:Starch-binding associating with outer membrane n=1 Tax=Pedobacter africanus TaxID=151894 RepID=A0A1W2ABP1_9SPHI|nr:SusD/RagB family nutrient-binding outer membrane lipoprotein [Pedobacter africanus]SMC58145.1 Starch-binding associating with outer membrane [Pedobacter africanus]